MGQVAGLCAGCAIAVFLMYDHASLSWVQLKEAGDLLPQTAAASTLRPPGNAPDLLQESFDRFIRETARALGGPVPASLATLLDDARREAGHVAPSTSSGGAATSSGGAATSTGGAATSTGVACPADAQPGAALVRFSPCLDSPPRPSIKTVRKRSCFKSTFKRCTSLYRIGCAVTTIWTWHLPQVSTELSNVEISLWRPCTASGHLVCHSGLMHHQAGNDITNDIITRAGVEHCVVGFILLAVPELGGVHSDRLQRNSEPKHILGLLLSRSRQIIIIGVAWTVPQS